MKRRIENIRRKEDKKLKQDKAVTATYDGDEDDNAVTITLSDNNLN